MQQCAQTDDEQWDVEAVNPFLDKAPLELMVVVSYSLVSAKESVIMSPGQKKA